MEKSAEELKKEAAAAWLAKYGSHVNEFLQTHYRFIGADIRRWMEREKGLEQPPHASSWATAFRVKVTDPKLATPSGLHLHVKTVQAHGRTSIEWLSFFAVAEGEMETLNAKLAALINQQHLHQIDVATAVKLAAQAALSYGGLARAIKGEFDL